MPHIRSHPALLAAFLVLSSLGAFCTKPDDAAGGDSAAVADSSNGDGASKLALPVAAAPVREGDLVLTVATTGQVRSDFEAMLKSEVQATIEQVLVRPGDHVKRGQVLVQLDTAQLNLDVRTAEAQVATARVAYRDTYYPDSVVTGRVPTEEQRNAAMARSGLTAALVNLDKAKLSRTHATVVSPFDGVVDRVDAAPGVRANVGDPLLRVVDLTHLRVEAQVLEHDLPLIKEGGEAIVTSSASRDHPIRGTILAVLPMVDTVTRSGRALVRIPPNTSLRPGMYTDVRLEAERLRNRRLVPTRAIIERDGRPLVFVVKDGRAQWVYINPGRSNGTETEVLPDSGTGQIPVEVGDQVVVEGHLTLTHDAPVRIVNADVEASTSVRKPD